MQVVACGNCGARNRVDEARLATKEARCGRCGEKLSAAAPGGEREAKPVTITDQTFERDVLQASGPPVLVDCWAPWCGPCRMVGPIMDELAAESAGRYRIAKLNVDDNPQTAARVNIASIPTMLIFKDGKLLERLIGAQLKQAIAERLQVALRSVA